MELEQWFADWGFKNNPFDYTLDADRDPYLEKSFIQNIGLRTSLSFDQLSPFVVFGTKGSGKTSIRTDLQRFLAAHKEKIITLSYTDFNDLLSEKNKGQKIIPSSSIFSQPVVQLNHTITLSDHLDNILRLGIEELYKGYLCNTEFCEKVRIRDTLKDFKEQKRRLILLMALYYMPTDIIKKTDGILKVMKMLRYKRQGYLLTGLKRKRLTAEICLKINGIPAIADNINQTISMTGTGLYESGDIPSNADQRFTLLNYLIELIRLLGLSGIYLLVDRVDEHNSIRGDSVQMHDLINPLLSDQLLQVNGLGMLLFLPYELQDLRKNYRSDRIKTVCPLEWSPVELKKLIEKRMSLFADHEITLSDLFAENQEGHEQFITNLVTPRNAFMFLEHLIKEHCKMVDNQKQIQSKTFYAAMRKFHLEKAEIH